MSSSEERQADHQRCSREEEKSCTQEGGPSQTIFGTRYTQHICIVPVVVIYSILFLRVLHLYLFSRRLHISRELETREWTTWARVLSCCILSRMICLAQPLAIKWDNNNLWPSRSVVSLSTAITTTCSSPTKERTIIFLKFECF